MNSLRSSSDYAIVLNKLKKRIRSAQYAALRAVNKELIALYWDIGKIIIHRQKKSGWGKSIVEKLSADLQKEFPGMSGFSPRNIWYMRNFYSLYSKNRFLQPLVAEISWSHNLLIMENCKNDSEREFYLKMARKFGWTKNVLIHQIDNKSYEKFLLNQTNFDKSLPEKYRHQAKLAIKDEYTFDFLELGEEHSEHELEMALINNLRRFLGEMGGYFAFIGNQYKIELEGEQLFIDLLLYHRALKCLVAIELKVSEFKPEHIGKMQFYLSVLNDKIRLKDENPSIGIIVCRKKKRTFVEYALKDASKPIGIATYTTTGKLPESLRKYLPSPDDIAKRLSGLNMNNSWSAS